MLELFLHKNSPQKQIYALFLWAETLLTTSVPLLLQDLNPL